MSDVGQKIKKIRKEKKLTLTDVAKDKMSAAMVSLIENGKSKPSAENLQHIAKQLGVSINDLLGGLTREELRKELAYLESFDTNLVDIQTLESKINHIQNLLPELSDNFESACIYEIYARSLFTYYFRYKSKFDLLADQNWQKYIKMAEVIYEDLQMENRIIRLRIFLANIETIHGNYQTSLQMVDDTMERILFRNDEDTNSTLTELMLLKLHILEALGDFEKSKQLLNEIIEFMNKHVLLQHFYEIYKSGAILYYNNGAFESAREFVNKLESFCEIIDNDFLYIEKEYLGIHFTDFFENMPEKAIGRIHLLEQKMERTSAFNQELKQELLNYLYDLKARCFTKLNKPREALPLFRELLTSEEINHIEMHPMDIGIRFISKAYQAECYIQLEEYGKALQYAEKAVKTLRKHPHTAYYHYARNVLHEVQMKLNF